MTDLAAGRQAVANSLRLVATAMAGAVIAVLVWWLLSTRMQPVQLPSPGAVWAAFLDGWDGIRALEYVGFQTGGIREGLYYTTQNVLVGAGVGTVLGLVVGWLVGMSRTAAGVLGPPLIVLGATPILVILPFILIWFGTNGLAQAALVVLFTMVTVAAVTQLAVTNVSAHYLNFAECLGASKPYLLWNVTRPAINPAVIGAIRVSVAMGWSFATVSELVGGQRGAGKIIQSMAALQRTADVLAVVLAVAAVAVAVDLVISLVGRWLVRWQE
jgi:ABC-type nitrate/sulfonate/bicarbonate transport system permease component